MKKILLILGSALLALTARSNTIVFSDLGAGNTYNDLIGYDVNAAAGAAEEVAAQFTAGTSGNLATVDLGLNYASSSQAGPVNVYLYADASGLPDNASQTFLGSGTPTTLSGTTNNTLVSFSVAGTIPVTIGTTYWLVLKPASSSMFDIWNFSLATTGLVANSLNDSTWNAGTTTLPAFRITAAGAATGVPDSGSTILLMLGSVAALLVLRQIFPREPCL
jgi:hypothetical protein